MKLFTYVFEGGRSFAVRHICLNCDKPVLIDTAHLISGEVYFCTYCGLDWRLDPKNADGVSDQLADLYEKMTLIRPALISVDLLSTEIIQKRDNCQYKNGIWIK